MDPQHTVLATHARVVVRAAERRGVAADAVLAGTGLRLEALEEPGARVALAPMLAIVERARLLTREPGLGVHVGLECPLSVHGFLGFGLLSAPALGDAVALLVEFERILGTAKTSSFTRAFRRWTGAPPSAYRHLAGRRPH